MHVFEHFRLAREIALSGAGALLAFLLFLPAAAGAEPVRGSYRAMDYGPVIAESIRAEWPEGNVAMKGLAVRLDHDSTMIFDTDLLRWAAGTQGGWVDLSRTTLVSFKDSGLVHTEGREVFATAPLPGWAHGGSFADPREGNRGNLPRDWARYRGYYRHGDRIVISCTVGGEEVLEMPRTIRAGEGLIFVRTVQMSGGGEARQSYVCAIPEGMSVRRFVGRSPTQDVGYDYAEGYDALLLQGGGRALLVGIARGPEGAALRVGDGARIELVVPAGEAPGAFHIFVGEVEIESPRPALEEAWAILREQRLDLRLGTAGGPARWPEVLTAPVTVAADATAYVVDSIGIPGENPWGSWMRLTALDFFADGERAAVATWNGDIWIVEGVGPRMGGEVRWRRFASGLYYPMGLAIVDETIYTLERSQVTRLHDLNGNGEADFYENFNNDSFVYPLAHALCLERDSAGNFYFFKNGNRTRGNVPDHAALIRVTADGERREVVATGIRGANSLAIGPGDTIVGADQQGHWVPTARVDHLREGRFYGFLRHRGQANQEPEPPICWVPHFLDNSSAGMVFAGDGRWGPMAGNFLLTSYGQGRLLAILKQEVGDLWQGGVVHFPHQFTSGLMRARMNPGDGQLYLVGMQGWSTRMTGEASFDRVRYTGRPHYLPVGLAVSPRGVELRFSESLSGATAAADFEVERWQYEYWPRYGSPEMSVANPGERGRDPVAVTAARLSEDRRTVYLEIPDIRPVMQMRVGYRLRFEDGGEVEDSVYHAIHRLRPEDETPRLVKVDAVAEAAGPATEEGEEEALLSPDLPDMEGAPPWFARGRELFQTNCATCHQSSGPAGIAPPMEDSEWAAGPKGPLIRIVLHGKLGREAAMMPFGWMDDAELATVLSYIRQVWHNQETVTAEEIGAVRQATLGRTELWTAEELRKIVESTYGNEN